MTPLPRQPEERALVGVTYGSPTRAARPASSARGVCCVDIAVGGKGGLG